MNTETADRLLDINRQFYQTFALQFSQTRRRIQPGTRLVMQNIPLAATILDLGCGNGEVWRELVNRGYTGCYIGIDSSQSLLDIAAGSIPTLCGTRPNFILADLASPDWQAHLLDNIPSTYTTAGFDFILALAVLHHLPGRDLRLQVLKKIHQLLSVDGSFIHSEWLFLNSTKFKSRLQPWSKVGLSEDQVDIGDYLLDWRHGGSGLRYVHQFEPAELDDLAAESNFHILDTFSSDGKDGNLALYQKWTAVK